MSWSGALRTWTRNTTNTFWTHGQASQSARNRLLSAYLTNQDYTLQTNTLLHRYVSAPANVCCSDIAGANGLSEAQASVFKDACTSIAQDPAVQQTIMKTAAYQQIMEPLTSQGILDSAQSPEDAVPLFCSSCERLMPKHMDHTAQSDAPIPRPDKSVPLPQDMSGSLASGAGSSAMVTSLMSRFSVVLVMCSQISKMLPEHANRIRFEILRAWDHFSYMLSTVLSGHARA